jgi:hypothetical protein
MVSWTPILVYTLTFGYLLLLIISLARWRGLHLAVKRHANTLLILLLLFILVVTLGGFEFFVGAVVFSIMVTVFLTMMAGPVGFLVGLLFGLLMVLLVMVLGIIDNLFPHLFTMAI